MGPEVLTGIPPNINPNIEATAIDKIPIDEPTPVHIPNAAPAAIVKKLTVNADVMSFFMITIIVYLLNVKVIAVINYDISNVELK